MKTRQQDNKKLVKNKNAFERQQKQKQANEKLQIKNKL